MAFPTYADSSTNGANSSRLGCIAQTLVDVLNERATNTPDLPAFSYLSGAGSEPNQLTYRELGNSAQNIAGKVAEIGSPGNRVLLFSTFGPHFVTSFFGCMLAGRIPVPVAAPGGRAALSGLAAIAADCDAVAAVAPAAALEQFVAASKGYEPLARLGTIRNDQLTTDYAHPPVKNLAPPAPDDIAFLQYTSGSTGSPRGVVVRHANLMHNLETIKQAFGHSSQTRAVIWLPAHHDMGLIGGVLQPIYAGFPVALMSPAAFLRSPFTWLQAVSTHGANTSGGPTFCYDRAVRKISPEQVTQLDLSSWEVAFVGAEPVNPRVLNSFSAHFAPAGFRASSFMPCYGLAESTLFVSGARRNFGMKPLGWRSKHWIAGRCGRLMQGVS